MGNRTLLSILFLFIAICLDKSNSTPTIDTTGYFVCENITTKDVAFTVDVTNCAGTCTVSVTNGDSVPFKTCDSSPTTKDICLKAPLDRETKSSYKVNVEAKDDDDDSTSSKTLDITIGDANDNAPVITRDPPSGSISLLEKTATPIKVSDISGSDPDDSFAGTFKFSLSGSEEDNFELTNVYSPAILNYVGTLDYEESQVHTITIVAEDDGSDVICGGKVNMKSSTTIYVYVEDGPDTPPVFLSPQYSATIKENSNAFNEEIEVVARDGDYGLDWTITYEIVGENSMFGINSATGLLEVIGNVDRESVDVEGGTYNLIVQANEVEDGKVYPGFTFPLNSTTTVRITIEDEDDNPPNFYNSDAYDVETKTYTAEIPESTQSSVPDFRIYVKDVDQGENAKTYLFLTDNTGGDGTNYFALSPSAIDSQGAVTLQITNILDFETRESYDFTVTANNTDGSQENTASIVIKLTDVNDNFPTYDQDVYEFSIPENSKEDAEVGTIVAIDADTFDDFGKVSYSLQPADLFGIDENGLITVQPDADLDREKRSEYYLTVNAQDGGGLQNRTQVTIYLTDENDEAPRFQQNQYLVNWNENTTGLEAVTVAATDLDEAGTNNSKLHLDFVDPDMNTKYKIEDADGDTTVTGSITPDVILDAETTNGTCNNGIVQYDIEVMVNDFGEPQNNDTTTISVFLRDINDNTPYFEESEYSGSVPEESDLDTIIAEISAKDDDKCDPNNAIVYTVDDEFSDKFLIGEDEGGVFSLRVKSNQLDRDDIDSYNVVIYAIDNGQPRLTATATVVVDITDVNNKPPIFDEENSDGSISVNENETVLEVVGTVVATDADEDSDLYYSIDQITCTDENGVENNDCENWFNVSTKDQKGEIFIENELDREIVETVSLRVKVVDKNATSGDQEDILMVQIKIEDYNDNKPQFVMPIPTFSVAEQSVIGTVIGQLSAVDRDSSTESIRFSTSSTYVAVSDDGQLTVAGTIDREGFPGEEFFASITIYDNGSPELTNNTKVYFNVTDTNDHSPEFNNTVFDCSIMENMPEGTDVCTITATDNDTGVNAEIFYSLPNVYSFTVNSLTGQITSAQLFDRENEDTYQFKLRAQDNTGSLRKTDVDITIRILDDDDNAPNYIDLGPQTLEITENNEPGDSVGEVLKANDEDTDDVAVQVNHYFLVYKPENSAISERFELDNVSRDLRAIETLDREENSSYILYVLTTRNETIHSDEYNEEDKDIILEVQVNVMDLNDNTPKFTSKAYTTDLLGSSGASDTDVVTTVLANDPDAGSNGALRYSITGQQYKAPDQSGNVNVEVFTIGENNGYLYQTGAVLPDVGGLYTLDIRVEDGGGLSDTSIISVKIFEDVESVVMVSRITVNELNRQRAELEEDLENALDADVVIDSILPHDGQSQEQGETRAESNTTQSDITFHATPWNETTLIPANDITTELDSAANNQLLVKWAIISVGTTEPEIVDPTSETDFLKTILVVVICLAVVILLVFTIAFIWMRKKYRTELRALKAASSTDEEHKGLSEQHIIPGTNINAQGENMLYLETQNGNINLEELQRMQGSSDDNNSIDDNEVDSQDSAISEGNTQGQDMDNNWDEVEIDFPGQGDGNDAANLAAALNSSKGMRGEENIIPIFDNPDMDFTAM